MRVRKGGGGGEQSRRRWFVRRWFGSEAVVAGLLVPPKTRDLALPAQMSVQRWRRLLQPASPSTAMIRRRAPAAETKMRVLVGPEKAPEANALLPGCRRPAGASCLPRLSGGSQTHEGDGAAEGLLQARVAWAASRPTSCRLALLRRRVWTSKDGGGRDGRSDH